MSGPELMRTMRMKFPDLTIEELLDRVRRDMITGHIAKLRAIKTDDVLDLLSEARQWNLSQEDVFELVHQIALTFPDPIAMDASDLIESKSTWTVYKFICKLQREPDPRGCFSWYSGSVGYSRSRNRREKSPLRQRA